MALEERADKLRSLRDHEGTPHPERVNAGRKLRDLWANYAIDLRTDVAKGQYAGESRKRQLRAVLAEINYAETERDKAQGWLEG